MGHRWARRAGRASVDEGTAVAVEEDEAEVGEEQLVVGLLGVGDVDEVILRRKAPCAKLQLPRRDRCGSPCLFDVVHKALTSPRGDVRCFSVRPYTHHVCSSSFVREAKAAATFPPKLDNGEGVLSKLKVRYAYIVHINASHHIPFIDNIVV